MQRVIFKECIIKVWNVMFSFSLGSESTCTLFRWGGYFCHNVYKIFIPAYNSAKIIKNPSRFSRVMVTNVLPPFYGSQCIYTLWVKKLETVLLSIASPNIDRFSNSFTIRLSKKLAIKWSLKIPPHLKCVATLPCKIWISKTRNNLKQCN